MLLFTLSIFLFYITPRPALYRVRYELLFLCGLYAMNSMKWASKYITMQEYSLPEITSLIHHVYAADTMVFMVMMLWTTAFLTIYGTGWMIASFIKLF